MRFAELAAAVAAGATPPLLAVLLLANSIAAAVPPALARDLCAKDTFALAVHARTTCRRLRLWTSLSGYEQGSDD